MEYEQIFIYKSNFLNQHHKFDKYRSKRFANVSFLLTFIFFPPHDELLNIPFNLKHVTKVTGHFEI